MSVQQLLQPGTEFESWSQLYMNKATLRGFELNNGILGAGRVLTSDGFGQGSWQAPSIPTAEGIIWRPGAISNPPYVMTWSEVYAAILAGTRHVYVDGSIANAIIPTTGMPLGGWVLNQVTFQGLSGNTGHFDTIIINDGVQLLNPHQFVGLLNIQSTSTTVPPLILQNGYQLLCSYGATLSLALGATQPFMVLNGVGAQIVLALGGFISNTSGNPFVQLQNLATFLFVALDNFQGAAPYSGTLVAGDGSGNVLLILNDSSIAPTTITLPGDIVAQFPIELASSTFYDDTKVPPATGSSNVQGAIDYVKSHSGVTFPILAPDGTGGAPSYSFASQPSTGLYQDSPQSMTFTAGGTDVLTINGSNVFIRNGQGIVGQNISAAGQFLAANGSGAAPAISFTSEPSDGLYWLAPGDVRMAVQGTDIMQWTPSETNVVNGGLALLGGDLDMKTHNILNVTDINGSPYPAPASFPLLAPDGTNVAPSYSFSDSPSTGIWEQFNFLNFSVQGATVLQMKSNELIGQGYNFNMNSGSIFAISNLQAGPTYGLNLQNFSGNTLIQLGDGSNQTLGFYGATPIVQPTNVDASAVYAAVGGGNVQVDDTFDGYTIGQVVRALRDLGILA
jgi:hypothetical protein